MRKVYFWLMAAMLMIATEAGADELYQKVLTVDAAPAGSEQVLVCADKKYMMSLSGSKIDVISTASGWFGNDDDAVIPFDERQLPSTITLIAAGDWVVVNFKGTDYCLYSNGTKSSPKLEVRKYDDDMKQDAKALWQLEDSGEGVILRNKNLEYCLVFSGTTFKLGAKGKSNQYVYIYNKVGEGVRIPESGYASYVTVRQSDFSQTEGLTAHIVTYATQYGVLLTPVERVPAYTAVVVSGAAGGYAVAEASGDVAKAEGNLLRPSDGGMSHRADGTSFYILDDRLSHGLGYYLATKSEIVPERTGYLIIRKQNDGREFIPIVSAMPADIEGPSWPSASTTDGDEKAYDLMGRRASKAHRQMIICRGKKYRQP